MRTHLKVHKITSESRTKQIQTEEKTSQKIKIWPNDVTGQRTLYELITLANRIQFTLFSLSICVFLFQVRCAFQGCFTKECLHDWLNYASSCSLCINLLLSLVDFVCACACVCTFNWRLYPSPLLIFAMFFFSRSLFFSTFSKRNVFNNFLRKRHKFNYASCRSVKYITLSSGFVCCGCFCWGTIRVESIFRHCCDCYQAMLRIL